MNTLNSPEVLRDVDDFCHNWVAPQAGTIASERKFYPGLLKRAAEIGLQSLLLSDDGNAPDMARMAMAHDTTERICEYSGAVGHTIGVGRLHSYLFTKYASQELIERWVPPIRNADAFCCFAVSEPNAGTDVRASTTVARRSGDEFVLSGLKWWIGLSPVASVGIVLAKVDSDARNADTVALVVDMNSRGVSVESSPELAGLRGMPNGRITFDHCVVPAENALNCDGFIGMMDGINLARIEASSLACGLLRGAIRLSVERAATRTAFGRPIGEMMGIQAKIGRMITDYAAAQSVTRRAAERFSHGDGGDRDLISMAKLFSTEAARRHTDSAMQIFGAESVPAAAEVGRLHNDAKITQIFDGTSEVHETMLGKRAVRHFQDSGEVTPPFLPKVGA
ncbi:acyl-CoA dehydrogenase family protein [Nesterenkonia populi]